MGKTERIIAFITKEEFCEKTHTGPECWIFHNVKNPKFWEDREDGREDWYYMDNAIDTIYRFKDMPQYGEVWMSKMDRKTGEWFCRGLWGTWTQYD